MQNVIIGVQETISNGAQEIELLVHSNNVGNPSPCHVYRNRVYRGLIGGSISSLNEILELEAANHPGFVVKQRGYYLTTIDPEPQEKRRLHDDSEPQS